MSELKKVISLVSRLQNNRGVQTRKDALRDFMAWFLKEKPEMDAYTMKLLLSGDQSKGYSLGIIQFCGKQKNAENTTYSSANGFAGYQYKESVKLALELWVSCVHETFGNHAKAFKNELKNIPIGVYIQARLDIHIQVDEEMKQYAGILIHAITSLTDVELNTLLPNESAQESFKRWGKARGIVFEDEEKNSESEDPEYLHAVSSNKNKRKKAAKWEEVREEDLIIDMDDDNGGNEEWFDTLDFVGKKKAFQRNDDDDSNVADLDDEDDDDDEGDALYSYSDPLNVRKPYYVKKSIDAFNKKKKDFFDLRIRTNDIIDTYYQFSPNITEENFNATNFLVEIHAETEFDELQNGLEKINLFAKDQSHKMKELVREHFDQFVYCKDTIDSIHGMLKEENMLNNTDSICTKLQDIDKNARLIYGNVLQRTKKAKVLIETLQLIKQPSFKFLFTLPQTVNYHIMMRNYDQIIRIYKRVKNIQKQSSIDENNSVLFKILSELNSTVSALKENLLQKLKESDMFGDEQEQIIFYLIQLDCEEDPAIYFLRQRHRQILEKMDECYKFYQDRASMNESDPQNNNNDDVIKKFIKKLSHTFISYIPSFWKLSKCVIDNKFNKQMDEEQESVKVQQKKKTMDYQNERIVKQLFSDITTKFIKYMEEVIAPNPSKENRKSSHLHNVTSAKDTLKFLLTAYSEIKSIKINESFLFGIDHLISQIVESFLHNMFEKSLQFILNNLCVEKWNPHRDIPGVTTTPLIFSDEISKNFQIIIDIGIKIIYDADDEFMNNKQNQAKEKMFDGDGGDDDDEYGPYQSDDDDDAYIPFKDDRSMTDSKVSSMSARDNDDSEDEKAANEEVVYEYTLNAQWLVPLIGAYFIESHKIFADCLHELAFPKAHKSSNDKHNNDGNKKINILSNYTDKSSDKKLLYVLGNTIYTKETILEKIWTKFIKKSGIIGIEYISILETSKHELIDLYNSLEQMVFDKYVRCKTLLLNRVIDNSLLCDGINWETLSEVKGIRNHCLQLLLHFVFIHNEVYNSSKQELDNVIISLLEKVSDHLLSTIKQIDSFSPSGALQILIEIDFIKSTLSKYIQADGSQIVFEQMQKLLYQYIDQDHDMIQKRKKQLTKHTQQSTAIMYSCFHQNHRLGI